MDRKAEIDRNKSIAYEILKDLKRQNIRLLIVDILLTIAVVIMALIIFLGGK